MRAPVLFISHGAPTIALDTVKGKRFKDWADTIERPRGILAISAHWLTEQPTIGTTTRLPLIYDFYGFPRNLYEVKYPANPAKFLAERLQDVSTLTKYSHQETRGWDHGVWTPLVHMYPKADVTILQISIPTFSSKELFELGRQMQSLRDEGILIVASGQATHNLQEFRPDKGNEPSPWAKAFDDWLAETLVAQNVENLIEHETLSPDFWKNHPTNEHFLPLLIAAGAGIDGTSKTSFPITGFDHGSLSDRCVQFG